MLPNSARSIACYEKNVCACDEFFLYDLCHFYYFHEDRNLTTKRNYN